MRVGWQRILQPVRAKTVHWVRASPLSISTLDAGHCTREESVWTQILSTFSLQKSVNDAYSHESEGGRTPTYREPDWAMDSA